METKNGASENSETKQNQPHNHHFIPRFYLKRFATKDTQWDKKKEKIYVIDKLHQHFEDEPRFIEHVGSENDYNTLRIDENHEDCATVENWLDKVIEKKQARLLDRIKTDKSIENIDKRELASLVAWMYCRVPRHKRVVKAIRDEMNYMVLSQMKFPIGVDRKRENNVLLNFMYHEPRTKAFLDVLGTFRYTLVTIPKKSKKFFITSDNPVTIACNEELSARYFAFCFFHPDGKYCCDVEVLPNYAYFINKSLVFLFLPIDRKFGLFLHRNKAAEDRIRSDANDELIDSFNSHTIVSADKEIYAPEITDELKVLVKNYWGNIYTFRIDTIQHTRDAYDFFMRNVCDVKGDYTCEDLARKIKDKRLFCSMRVFLFAKNDTVFRPIDEPIPSTHQYALLEENQKFWLEALQTHALLVLFAPLQTDGIGSHGRKWISDKEDFHVNLIFYTDKILPFSQIAAYTACQLLARETRQTQRFKIKWPNDVMVEDWNGDFKKIGGCLTAVRKEDSRFWVTIGVGLNYNLENFSNIDQPTASVKSFLNSLPKKCGLHRERDFTRDELFQSVQRFAELFLENFALVQKNGLEAFYDKEDLFCRFGSKNYWLYLGQKVTVFDEDKKKQLTGRFDKLTDDGALQLACDNGKTEIVLNGTGLKSLISEVAKYDVFPLD